MLDNPLFDAMLNGATIFNRWRADVVRSVGMILIVGGLFSYLQGLMWVVFIQRVVALIVITTMITAIAVPALGMLWCFEKSGNVSGVFGLKQNELASTTSGGEDVIIVTFESEAEIYHVMAILLAIFVGLVSMFIIKQRKNMHMAIGMHGTLFTTIKSCGLEA